MPTHTDITITEVVSKQQRRTFVEFPLSLYRDCPLYVPPLLAEEIDALTPGKNPAFTVGQARLYLAYRSGQLVGRVAAILSLPANKKNKARNVRFGWFDCIDDYEVARALFNAVEAWARELGMETISGPHGFDLFDKAGMLIEGFDQLPTSATYYNHPYYNEFTTRYGFEKEIDFIENRMTFTSDGFAPEYTALAESILRKRKYRLVEFRQKRQLLQLAPAILDLFEDTYADLYDYVPLTREQHEYYIKKFFPFLKKELVKVVANEQDEIIGFLIAMPSLSRALQKAKGQVLPFGFLHLFKALKMKNDTLDFCLAGVRKSYRGKGVDLIMTADIYKTALRLGFEFGESNPELETNLQIQAQWNKVDHVVHKRRRIYCKAVAPA